MKREEVASKIHWARIIWFISVINPLMTLPQIIQLLSTREAGGLSFGFLGILFLVQGGFALHGFFIA